MCAPSWPETSCRRLRLWPLACEASLSSLRYRFSLRPAAEANVSTVWTALQWACYVKQAPVPLLQEHLT